MSAPLPMAWDGECLKPVSAYHAKQADKAYVIGERYLIAPVEERSAASHRQYFAAVNDYWSSLPEHLSEQFPTADHLRKRALIKCGYADHRAIVCGSKAEAVRVAAFIRPMDEFALVTAIEACVSVWTAKSQTTRAMPKAEFQASKTAVLEYLENLIGAKSEHDERRAA